MPDNSVFVPANCPGSTPFATQTSSLGDEPEFRIYPCLAPVDQAGLQCFIRTYRCGRSLPSMGQATEYTMGRAFKPIALVVEDDPDQRELLKVLLEEAELHVFACESAEAALRILDT